MYRIILFFQIILFCSFGLDAQKNFIIIIADDLGVDWCGFHPAHQDTLKLTNVRRLLANGVNFTNAWATPYCSSTRAATFTGRYGFRTGVGTVIDGANSTELDTAEIALAALLKKHKTAYATANIGKWHMSINNQSRYLFPSKFGYDYYAGVFGGTPMPDYFRWNKVTQGIATVSTNYLTQETVSNAIDWLNTTNNKPFYLWLALNAPHFPFHLPPDSLHSYRNLSGTARDIEQNPKSYFKAMAEAMDIKIGRMLDWLEQNNKLDSTYIIFFGDNGDDERTSQTIQTRRSKGTVYESGIRVPMIISGPGIVAKGKNSDALINVVDIFATILDLSDFDNWRTLIRQDLILDSKSQVPVLNEEKILIRSWIYSENFLPSPTAVENVRTMRGQRYKLIHFDNGSQQFYDLLNDENEMSDLLKSQLNADAKIAYHYLCNEMENLLSKPICDLMVNNSQINSDNINIYYSPNEKKIIVNPQILTELKLFTMQGQLIEKIITSTDVNVSHLAPGLYLVRTLQQNKKTNIKIIIF